MAHSKAKACKVAETASIAATGASAALRTAAAGRRLDTAHLTELCNAAADELALAHRTLFSETGSGEEAMAHLDAALACLKQLAGESERAARAPTVRRRAS